jgi:hypothetical protein
MSQNDPAERAGGNPFAQFPEIKPPTAAEAAGLWQMSIVLGVICLVTVGFWVSWMWTEPTLADARSLLGTTDPAGTAVEVLLRLRSEHLNQYREMFQMVVLSGLVPLFTLLAGYMFGRGQAARSGEGAE